MNMIVLRILCVVCAAALRVGPRAHRGPSALRADPRSVSELVGNQHGGKYAFDESYVEGAGSGANYARRAPKPLAPDDAWAAAALDAARAAPSFDALADACGGGGGDAFETSDAATGDVEIRNDEPTWETIVAEVVGPGRDSYEIKVVLGSKGSAIDGPRVTTSLPPRRGGGRGVVIRLARAGPACAGAVGWAALVVAAEGAPPRVWRL